jgi:hypothetical protein
MLPQGANGILVDGHRPGAGVACGAHMAFSGSTVASWAGCASGADPRSSFRLAHDHYTVRVSHDRHD